MWMLRKAFGIHFFGRVALLLVAICFFVTNVAHASSHEHSLFSSVPGDVLFLENPSHNDDNAERHVSEARHCHGCFLSLLPRMDQLAYSVKSSQLSYFPLPANEAYVLRSFDVPPPK
jgi:hypothetical protein